MVGKLWLSSEQSPVGRNRKKVICRPTGWTKNRNRLLFTLPNALFILALHYQAVLWPANEKGEHRLRTVSLWMMQPARSHISWWERERWGEWFSPIPIYSSAYDWLLPLNLTSSIISPHGHPKIYVTPSIKSWLLPNFQINWQLSPTVIVVRRKVEFGF